MRGNVKDNDLKRLRSQIDKIDEEILGLINDRTRCALEIGSIKKEQGREFYVPSREREVIKRLSSLNKGPFPSESLRVVYREIMSACLSLEHPLKVAFLGPHATFTHMACIEHFGSSVKMISKNSIGDVFDDVERGRADYGVVPVENSNEGMVTHTLDKFVDSSASICGEVLLEVSHCLLSKSGRLEDVKKICSHSQPIAQCREWLSSYVPEISFAGRMRDVSLCTLPNSQASVRTNKFHISTVITYRYSQHIITSVSKKNSQ